MQFGRKSEKLDKQIEQLELRLEDLEAQQSYRAASTPRVGELATEAVKPVRRPLPDHLPRETETYTPDQNACPDCGGKLRLLGEDVSEVLEYVPARFKVIRQVRPKLSWEAASASCKRRRRAARFRSQERCLVSSLPRVSPPLRCPKFRVR